MQRKLNLQKELLAQLALSHPDLGLVLGEISDPDMILEKWKNPESSVKVPKKSLELIRELKVNRLQYNQLIKKAPYNWVAKISGFQAI